MGREWLLPFYKQLQIYHGYTSIKDIHSPTILIRVPCLGTVLFKLLAKSDFERNRYYFVKISIIDMMSDQNDCKQWDNWWYNHWREWYTHLDSQTRTHCDWCLGPLIRESMLTEDGKYSVNLYIYSILFSYVNGASKESNLHSVVLFKCDTRREFRFLPTQNYHHLSPKHL
jgi:hypothetical protein